MSILPAPSLPNNENFPAITILLSVFIHFQRFPILLEVFWFHSFVGLRFECIFLQMNRKVKGNAAELLTV